MNLFIIINNIMSLDQFYTKDEIAKKYYDIFSQKLHEYHICIDDYDYIMEPSAGKGAFFKLLPDDKKIAVDLEPKYEGIIKMDFLKYKPINDKKYIIIGNPPFGRVSSLAVKFFNKASAFADIIAFIVPKTFKRVSIQNKLSLEFKLIYNEDLSINPCCFEPEMSAKCCFQIWIKDVDNKRKKIILPSEHKDFKFLKLGPKDKQNQPTPPKDADFVIKAYGSNCGEIVSKNLQNLRPKSWHWIKSNINIKTLQKRFKSLDYSISKDTARQDSIGQKEIIYLYSFFIKPYKDKRHRNI
jgi:hypothetical protein